MSTKSMKWLEVDMLWPVGLERGSSFRMSSPPPGNRGPIGSGSSNRRGGAEIIAARGPKPSAGAELINESGSTCRLRSAGGEAPEDRLGDHRPADVDKDRRAEGSAWHEYGDGRRRRDSTWPLRVQPRRERYSAILFMPQVPPQPIQPRTRPPRTDADPNSMAQIRKKCVEAQHRRQQEDGAISIAPRGLRQGSRDAHGTWPPAG